MSPPISERTEHVAVAPTPGAIEVAFYGDDFTGSADAMEVLQRAGWETALFLAPPTPAQLARYPGIRAIGIAGGSRTMQPRDMEAALPQAFESLKRSGARFIHYKLCSTFDSSPQIGSVGKAIELGRQVCGERPTPLVVGSPELGRYVVFGNLFARSGLDTEPARLDRHPTMRHHPITPMDESDLRLHLKRQTTLPMILVDVLRLDQWIKTPNERSEVWDAAQCSPQPIVLFDTLREEHLAAIGRCLVELAGQQPLFVAGSSAVEHALIAEWRRHRPVAEAGDQVAATTSPADAFDTRHADHPTLVVSGSCSPVTARQIQHAIDSGCDEYSLEPRALLADSDLESLIDRLSAVLAQRQSLVVHTSLGPADARLDARLPLADRRALGHRLGCLLDGLLSRCEVGLTVVCGGDTSMEAARSLGIESLRYAGPGAPGSPICRVTAPRRAADGRWMVFKGGQNGHDRFLAQLLPCAAAIDRTG